MRHIRISGTVKSLAACALLVVISYLARQEARQGGEGRSVSPAGPPASLPYAPFAAKVTGVADGDTLTVLDNERRRLRIRLHGIDAPELHQAFGRRAREALADLVDGRSVRVAVIERDRYERLVADLYVGTNWVNAVMVAQGWAWHYRHHSDARALTAAERSARAQALGLWRGRDPLPPWNWRQLPGNQPYRDRSKAQ